MIDDYKQGYMNRVNLVKTGPPIVACIHTYKKTKQWLYDDIPKNSTVLDYGCGNGTFQGLPTRSDLAIIGYDIDQLNENAMYHDIKDLKSHYDVIVMSHVVEHLLDRDVRDTLKWAAAHCNRIYITTPNAELNPFIPFHCDSTHVKPMNHGEFPMWLLEAGFNKIQVVWSGIPTLPWYQLLFRVLFSKLSGVSIFEEYCVIADR